MTPFFTSSIISHEGVQSSEPHSCVGCRSSFASLELLESHKAWCSKLINQSEADLTGIYSKKNRIAYQSPRMN